MHTRMDLLLAGVSEAEAVALASDAARETGRIEKRLNRFDYRSDLWQINNQQYYGKCAADAEMRTLFAGALRYREQTLGAFDICIQTEGYRPETDYYTVDDQREEIVLNTACVTFDFGGYAKGYALERVCAMVKDAGVQSGLISFGNSSVCGIGTHPTGQMWQVGVENPLRVRESMTMVTLCDCALSSSGNTPRNRGHIRSARTGLSVEDDRVVSVAGDSALDCEVLSTALFTETDRAQRERIFRNFRLRRVAEMTYSADGCSVNELL